MLLGMYRRGKKGTSNSKNILEYKSRKIRPSLRRNVICRDDSLHLGSNTCSFPALYSARVEPVVHEL